MVSFGPPLRTIAAIFLCTTLVALASCASSRPKPIAAPGLFQPPAPVVQKPLDAPKSTEPEPIYAVFGRSLIIPADRITSGASRLPEARLDDGRKIRLSMHRIEFDPVETANSASTIAALRWIGGAASWRETAFSKASAAAPSLDFCEIELPVDAYGHWLWIGPVHLDVVWIKAEKQTRLPEAPGTREARSDLLLRECLRLDALNPSMRWRSELFGISAQPALSLPIPFDPAPSDFIHAPPDETFLDKLALQSSALWAFALGRLASVDPPVHKRVIAALTESVRLESGGPARFAPAWSDGQSCAELLHDLLAQRDEPKRLAAVARDWLGRRPGACAWVVDDAGLLDADSRLPIPRIGIANLSDAQVVAWARGESDGFSPELLTIAAETSRTITVPAIQGPAPAEGTADRQGVEVHIGGWSGLLNAQRRHTIAAPPGVPISPTFLDHTMSSWTRGISVSPVPAGERSQFGALAGRLVREAGPTNVPSGSGWSLYLEIERSAVEHQTLRIWLGPTGRSTHVLVVDLPETSRIPESGEAVALVRAPAIPGARDELLAGAQIIPSADHWTLRLPIPNRAVERPGLLRIGVEHVRGAVRSCWPRAMFPWATEPGRASIDLSKW